MVEAGFTLLPFLAMFFALYDFTLAIFLKNTMQFAVRQGVRYAVTSQVQHGSGGQSLGHDLSIKNVVDQNSMGFLGVVAPAGLGRPCAGLNCISIQYFSVTVNPATGVSQLTEVTGPGSNVGGNVVQISANNLTWAWMVPLMRSASPLAFSVSSADIMEGTPLGGPPAR